MRASKLIIENFKRFSNVTLHMDNRFNVIIGPNNMGKTTVLEAILLWKKCYDICITAKKKTFYSVAKNVNFEDLSFLRISDDFELFNETKISKARAEITLVIIDDQVEYKLGFRISKATSISNAYFQLNYIDRNEFVQFQTLTGKYGKNLSSLIAVSETKPISNIINKEPYMYKIINNDKKKIENYINNIFGKKYAFVEKEKENKDYIKLLVSCDGKQTDLLSQGSGFLQVAEIFSSFEFFNAELYLLLIDEPDSHVHLSLQKKLISEFRALEKCQLFVVSHNENFIEEVNDHEILFLNSKDIAKEVIMPLEKGSKQFVIEELVGELSDIVKLRMADRILVVEGRNDQDRIERLVDIYTKIASNKYSQVYLIAIDGIDNLLLKLQLLVNSYKKLAAKDVEWIVLRDTDCIPFTSIPTVAKNIENSMPCVSKQVIFQNGYEFESAFLSDTVFLAKLLNDYYGNINAIKPEEIATLNKKYLNDAITVTSETYKSIKVCFERQKKIRGGEQMNNITIEAYLQPIKEDSIQYIMSKRLLNEYLSNVHIIVGSKCRTSNICLTHVSLTDFYLEKIASLEDFHPFHLELMETLFS
jgi:AAA15 family ATPase/GTPase